MPATDFGRYIFPGSESSWIYCYYGRVHSSYFNCAEVLDHGSNRQDSLKLFLCKLIFSRQLQATCRRHGILDSDPTITSGARDNLPFVWFVLFIYSTNVIFLEPGIMMPGAEWTCPAQRPPKCLLTFATRRTKTKLSRNRCS